MNLAAETIHLLRSIDARLSRLEAAAGAGPANDDGWTRLPPAKGRCAVSGWSRATIMRRIAAGQVRSKSVQGSRFYASADVLKLITSNLKAS